MPLETQRPTAMNNCCKDCPDRVVGCHSACDRYILAKQKHDRLMKEYKKVTKPSWYACKDILRNVIVKLWLKRKKPL